MRKDARLSGRALAAAMSWHFTKVSKIENGSRSPSEEDIRTWCSVCDAADQIPDLIATVRHIDAMYHEYRRQMQAGLKHLTESSVPLYEKTSLFRIYDTTVVPGLFTTAEYAAAIFRFWSQFMGLKDDVDAAVEARMERQRVLYTGERHSLTQGSFWMFDDSRVRIETVSASLTITQPRDIALYSRVFELLQQSAVHGREARQLISGALRDLTGEAG